MQKFVCTLCTAVRVIEFNGINAIISSIYGTANHHQATTT